MRNYFLFNFLAFILFSCVDNRKIPTKTKESKQDSTKLNISFLFPNDTLILVFEDAKCGEWGGDFKQIKVYKKQIKNGKEIVLFDVSEYKMNCDSIEPLYKQKQSFLKKKIIATIPLKVLLMESVKEIMELKINTAHTLSNGGAISGIRTMDSTLYISIYPSPKWTKFIKLFSELKNVIGNK